MKRKKIKSENDSSSLDEVVRGISEPIQANWQRILNLLKEILPGDIVGLIMEYHLIFRGTLLHIWKSPYQLMENLICNGVSMFEDYLIISWKHQSEQDIAQVYKLNGDLVSTVPVCGPNIMHLAQRE